MTETPRSPELRSGGARNVDSGREHRIYARFPVESQDLVPLVTDLAEERFRRDLERLHRLGPCAYYQMLDELGARHLLRTEIEALAKRYSRIDPAKLIAAGGDKWPPR